jgi:hypothetical protein
MWEQSQELIEKSFAICTVHYSGIIHCVRFEVFTAVAMKNGVFWDVTPCGIS